MRTMRTFQINNAKAGRFKEYCRDMHISTEITDFCVHYNRRNTVTLTPYRTM